MKTIFVDHYHLFTTDLVSDGLVIFLVKKRLFGIIWTDDKHPKWQYYVLLHIIISCFGLIGN